MTTDISFNIKADMRDGTSMVTQNNTNAFMNKASTLCALPAVAGNGQGVPCYCSACGGLDLPLT
jgi:hypothetical protein